MAKTLLWWIGAALLGLQLLAAPRSAMAAGATDDSVEAVVDALGQWLRHDFALADRLVLDPALRTASQRLVETQLPRINRLFRAWTTQEAAALTAEQRRRQLAARLVSRYHNEMALWTLDTTGDAFDRQMLKALSHPGLCRAQSEQAAFARVVLAIQHLPADERASALAAHEQLLARWGQPRMSVPERPSPGLMERAEQTVQRLADADRPATERPLPPMLAWLLLGTPPRKLGDDSRCNLRHWWLMREQAQPGGAREAELMRNVRYAQLADRLDLLRELNGPATTSTSDYPPLAHRLAIEGTVAVRGIRGPEGRGLDQGRVVSRRIVVPGLGGTRPVLFETVFDEASLQRARAAQAAAADSGREATVQLVWKLEP